MDFDSAAATWDDDQQRALRTRAIADEVRSRLGDRTYRRALDFGAGTGSLSLLLADRFDEVVLVDTSPAMLAVAAGKVAAAAPAARFRPLAVDLADPGGRGRPEPGSVDVVYSSMALHHVGDIAALLRAFRELLAPEGLLLVADLVEDEDGGYHAHDEDFDGHHGFRRSVLETELASAGFAPSGFSTVFVVHRDGHGEGRDYPIFLSVSRRLP